MRPVGKPPFLLVGVFVLILFSCPEAAEWTKGAPIGPSVRSLGIAASEYAGSAYLFVATDKKMLWKKAGSYPWSSKKWDQLDFQTDTAPAAVQFAGSLYLFARNPNAGGAISYATYDGDNWSQWKQTSWSTISSPAVAAGETSIHLLWRDTSNKLFTASMSAGSWSSSVPIGGLLSDTAPAAQYFDGQVYLFAKDAATKQLFYKRLSDSNWHIIEGFDTTQPNPMALAVSNGKLFVFAQKPGIGYYRILDRTHGRDDFLPIDGWVAVESGRARSNLAALGIQDTLHLFYSRNHSSASLPGIPAQSAPYIFVQSAAWSTAHIAILPLAKGDCSNIASTSDFPELIRVANSVYNPLMIRFNLKRIYPEICNDFVWDLDNQFIIPGDSNSGKNNAFFYKLEKIAERPVYSGQVVIFVTNKSGGGGFSGFSSKYIYFPDQPISVCNSGGVSSDSPYLNGFAHEIGHYCGLPHTFRDVVNQNGHYRVAQTISEVQQALEAANYDISTFDLDPWTFIDGFGVYDTPPDPLYQMNGVSDMKCANVSSPLTLVDNRTDPPVPIVLVPPRTNLMSYYQVSATIINKLTTDQGRVIYEGLRRKGIIKN